MSCSKCGSTTAGCGCKDTAYTTPTVTTCVPACPPKCAEYVSATCVLMQDGIDELGSNPGDTLESIIQRLTLIITNPLCVDWNPGSGGGGGGGGGGIVQVGLVAPSNLFETPIVPVTTPGGDLTLTLNDQSSNTVFAGPASGPANTPQFRALVIDDLPDLTVGNCVLMGDGAGKFACVTIGPNLSFSGGVLDANINVVIGADNGLTKDPLNTDTVWLGGPSTDPGVLIQDTFIDTTNQFRLNLYGNNPASKRGVLEVTHTSSENAIKAIANTGTAVSANTIGGVGVYASDTGNGTALLAESSSGLAISYTATNSQGIVGDSALENNLIINSLTPPDDSTISSVLRLSKVSNATSAAGFGSQLTFSLSNDSNVDTETSSIVSVFTNPTAPSETADLEFSIIGGGAIETVGRFIGDTGLFNGQFQLIKYGANTFNVGTPLYGLAVDGSGKVMEVPLASGLGTVDNGLSLNPSVSSEAWLGGTLVNPAGTTITVPNGLDFVITGDTTATNKSVLEINNTAGASATRALTVSSGGVSPAIYVSQTSSSLSSCIFAKNSGTGASSSYGIISEANITPFYGRTTQTANTTQIELLKLHNRSTGSGGNGIGGYISLAAATVSNSDQEAARIGYQFTDATTSTRKGQLEFYTANGAAPAQRMTIKETGQIQFNNYTTATSFTTALGASLLGIDTSGNVVNSVGENGLTYSTTTGNIKLGGTLIENTTIVGSDKSLTLTFDGLTGTNGLNVTSSNTTAVASQTLINAVLSGVNATANVETYTISGANNHVTGGATSNNYGIYGTATGGDQNYGVGGRIAGTATGAAVYGRTTSNNAPGVEGSSSSTAAALSGTNTNTSGLGLSISATGSNGTGGIINGRTTGLIINALAATSNYGVSVTSNVSSFATIYTQGTDCRNLFISSRNSASVATNIVRSSIEIRQQHVFGTATTSGFGSSIDFTAQAGTNQTSDIALANSIISKWTDAANATRTSEFSITGVDTATTYTLLQISGTGIFTLSRGLSDYASDAAAAAGGIPLNGLYRNGNVVQIRIV